MKKKMILLVTAIMLIGIMTACGSQSSSSASTSTDTPVITDLQTSDADIHEDIVPYDAGEDVTQENPYYVRTTDSDGSLVYAVMKADTKEIVYLPVGSTVVYSGDDGDCYYERKTITYKSDGEDRENIQYQLYVRNADSVDDEINTTVEKDDIEVSSEGNVLDITLDEGMDETIVDADMADVYEENIPVESTASSETVSSTIASGSVASDSGVN